MSHLDNEVYSWRDLSSERPPPVARTWGLGRRSVAGPQIQILAGLKTSHRRSSRVTGCWQGELEPGRTARSSTWLTARVLEARV